MPDIAEKLFDSVNATARIVRTSLLLFLVVALYLLIIVGTTTDLMLLRGEIVALPLMEVGVPVVAFYIVAPLIFLLLHSNLLLRLSQLTVTVNRWKRTPDGLEDGHSPLVFPLDFALLLLDGKPRWALYVVVVTQIAILPLIVLLALQMSFLAYQNSFITFWHQLIVTADLVLLFLSVCFVIGTREERKVKRNYVLQMLFRMWGRVFSAGLVLISAGLVLILTWTIAVVPNSWQETMGIFVAMLVGLFFLFRYYVSKRLRNRQDKELNKFFLPTKVIVLYGFILFSLFGIFAIAVDDLQERFIQRQLSAWVFADWWWKEDPITSYRPARRFLNVAEQLIVLKEIPPEIVGALIIKEAELKGEEDKLDPLCEYIGELDLSGRQLNYARFYGSQFRCVKLNSAELHGADLSNTELNGANLHGADLSNTELHGANLLNAKLHGADLSGAELHGALLIEAELHGANLGQSELYGADLRWTELYGAKLQWAELHGADLSNAKLHGADLRLAELHGADLSNVELHGADLSEAKLYGANLSGAELRDVDLFGAKLYGADLGQAILKKTDLSYAHWYKPKDDWDNIISSIRDGLKIRISSIRDISKKRGLADDEINHEVNRLVSRIEENSSAEFGFVPPTIPIATDYVCHSGQGPFKEWPEPGKGCDSEFISAVVEVACQNQWTAKSIVNRAFRYGQEDIDLITALLNANCSSLDPYREELNDKHEELNQ